MSENEYYGDISPEEVIKIYLSSRMEDWIPSENKESNSFTLRSNRNICIFNVEPPYEVKTAEDPLYDGSYDLFYGTCQPVAGVRGAEVTRMKFSKITIAPEYNPSIDNERQKIKYMEQLRKEGQ